MGRKNSAPPLRSPTVEALALSAELGPRVATALLTKLEEAGLVHWEDDTIRVNDPDDSIDDQARSLAGQFETLRTQDRRRLDAIADYVGAGECRAAVLRAYFGEEAGVHCGLCDVCCRRPARPESLFAPLAPPSPKRKSRGRTHGRTRRGTRRRTRSS